MVANLTEAEALLQLSNCQESDEGIVSDQSSVTDPEDPTARRSKVRHLFIKALYLAIASHGSRCVFVS